ncbi:MAG: cysteine peptidase family C39 domain-containing protein [Isosphaeraceae bacterium]|nr:cysteine peptidase family C39 domain-containing protein [Isosphaeraceae bacterium]
MFPQLLLFALVLLAQGGRADVPRATEGTKSLPCGLSSLYFLGKFYGKEISLDDLRAHLRTDSDGNCSFRDMIEAGRRTGLELVAYRLRPTDPIDRPMIVALEHGHGGHFVAVHPVGHTGKLVQVLDYPEDPSLLDESVFRSSHRWTGIVLVPKSPRVLIAYAVILLGVLLCAAAWYFGHLRRIMVLRIR